MDSSSRQHIDPQSPQDVSRFYRPIKQGILLLAFAFLIFALALGIHAARALLLVFLIGIGLGVVITPTIEFLRRKQHIPRAVSALLFFLLFVGLLGGVGFSFIHIIKTDLLPLVDRLPEIIESAERNVKQYAGRFPFLSDMARDFSFADYASKGAGALASSAMVGGMTLFHLVFVIAISLYYALDSKRYMAGFLSAFPARVRPRMAEVMGESGQVLRKWLFAQMMIMAAVGTLTAFALWLLGIEQWLLFGVLAGLLDIVPYVGPILSGLIIGLMTLGSDPDKFWLVLLAFLIIQQTESYLITPYIYRGRADLPPVHILLLILIMENWFGLLGVFMALPIFAVSKHIYEAVYVPIMDKKITFLISPQDAPPSAAILASGDSSPPTLNKQ